MSIIDLTSKSKNLFSDLIKEVIAYGGPDEIMHDLSMPELLNLPQEIQTDIGKIASDWWTTNSIILGDELSKKTVDEMSKTVLIYAEQNFNNDFTGQDILESLYKVLICITAITGQSNETIKKQLDII
tara:strand:+ start:485 stop:868 length:384 start_codon:yes stop_codon:yes gene_type:complete